MKLIPVLACLLLVACSRAAQTTGAAPSVTSEVNGFIVTDGDITHRPYDLLGLVSVTVSRRNLISTRPDRQLVDDRLIERARQIGADAVIRVIYSPTPLTASRWAGTKAEGMAIRYRRTAR